jgi:hypothetical protein
VLSSSVNSDADGVFNLNLVEALLNVATPAPAKPYCGLKDVVV